jgi:hypothetical protein
MQTAVAIFDFGTYLPQRLPSSHPAPHTAAHRHDGPRSRSKIEAAGQVGRTRTLRKWGGWGSNPGPADYESGPPVAPLIAAELRKGTLG